MSEDNEFLKNLQEVNSSGHAQQAPDLNSSNRDLDCSGPVDTLESDDASTKPRLFDRVIVDSPSTSAGKRTTYDTQALINQTILQQLTAISERLNKIDQKIVQKTLGPHKFKSRSTGTKNNKVVNQSDSTHTSNHSARMHTNVTDTHTITSTVSLPTLDHLKKNDSIQKVVVERLSELQQLNSTGMSQKLKSQRGGVEVFVKHKTK